MQNVDDFIKQLLDEKGITDVAPDIRKDLERDMKARLLEEINRAAALELSEEQSADLARKLDDDNFTESQITEFMQNSGIDLAAVAKNTMIKFRNLYLETEE